MGREVRLTLSIWKPQAADEQDRHGRITFPCDVEKCDEHILATKLAKKMRITGYYVLQAARMQVEWAFQWDFSVVTLRM